MRPTDCARENDVLEALQTSAWPDCCPAELRAHVDTCRTCADLVAVVLPLIDEHRAAALHAPIPTSGVVWWRAQMRARQEAAAAAMRPITIVQGIALACTAGLLAGAASLVSPAFRGALGWAVSAVEVLARAGTPAIPDKSGTLSLLSSPLGIAVVLAFAMVVIVMPVAIYLAAGDD
jgi:hypothetical protein